MKYSSDGSDGSLRLSPRVSCQTFPWPHLLRKGMRCSQRRVCRHQWTANVKPCVLLRIAIDELNLESGVVKEKYLGRLHIKIRTEKNLPYDLVSAFEFRYHDLDLPFEGLPF